MTSSDENTASELLAMIMMLMTYHAPGALGKTDIMDPHPLDEPNTSHIQSKLGGSEDFITGLRL